ncbi:NACHT domain-containing protein [Streptomyces hyaluromycini]|uniref:NACHT domain-containing protein n=1 Tax=Streptomyces hyaluromycini TaxID=1377993 RepID=A0ABV1X1I6_9ACTN
MFYGGRRQRRAWGWGLSAGAVAVTVAAAVWIVRAYQGGLDSGEVRSALVGVAFGVLGLAVALLAMRTRAGSEPDLGAASARLAQAVKNAESAQWLQLLGGDRVFIDVDFTFAPVGGPRTAVVSGSPGHRLASVVEAFRATTPQRLLVTGAPGAGKTVLATRLVLELVKARDPGLPVPMRLPLAEWDPELPVEEWITSHLVRDYDIAPALARDFVDNGLILPVFDGLDEMGERAGAALDALDSWTEGGDPAPLVLTCRAERYAALVEAGHRLLEAASIEVSPVTPEQARTYLAKRTARRMDVWRVLLADLRAEPDGLTRRTLSTPWLLSVAATVYARDGLPTELLLCTTRQEAADLLLRQYVQAVTGPTTATPAGYTPRRVHRWLHVLAVHLEGRTDMVPGPWLVPVRRTGPVRLADVAVALGLTAATVLAVLPVLRDPPSAAWLSVLIGARTPREQAFNSALFYLLVCVLCCLTAVSSWPAQLQAPAPLHRLRPSLVRPIVAAELRDGSTVLYLLLAFGSVAGYVVLGGVAGRPVGELVTMSLVWAWGLGWFVVVRPVLAVLRGAGPMAGLAPVWIGPGDVLRADWLYGIVVSLGAMALVLLPGGLWALPFVVVLTFWTMSRGSRRYLLALLFARGRVPFRFARFLRWAHGAGLLRVSGPAYQFRHREFQEWLVRHPEALPTDSPAGRA